MFQIFLGGGQTLVTDMLVNQIRFDAGFQLVADKGMTQIIDFGIFDTGFFKIAVNGSADIPD